MSHKGRSFASCQNIKFSRDNKITVFKSFAKSFLVHKKITILRRFTRPFSILSATFSQHIPNVLLTFGRTYPNRKITVSQNVGKMFFGRLAYLQENIPKTFLQMFLTLFMYVLITFNIGYEITWFKHLAYHYYSLILTFYIGYELT